MSPPKRSGLSGGHTEFRTPDNDRVDSDPLSYTNTWGRQGDLLHEPYDEFLRSEIRCNPIESTPESKLYRPIPLERAPSSMGSRYRELGRAHRSTKFLLRHIERVLKLLNLISSHSSCLERNATVISSATIEISLGAGFSSSDICDLRCP